MTDWKDYSKFIEQANEHTIDDKQIKMFTRFITHAPVHINDFRGVRARYVKRTG